MEILIGAKATLGSDTRSRRDGIENGEKLGGSYANVELGLQICIDMSARLSKATCSSAAEYFDLGPKLSS